MTRRRAPGSAGFASFSSRLLREEMERPFGGTPPADRAPADAPPPLPAPRRVSGLVILEPPRQLLQLGFARRRPPEPRCIVCGRPGSTHGAPVEVGGESIVPACELLHPGGLVPYGPPDPVVRAPAVLRQRGFEMPLVVARGIAGNLGQPSKMPGASYGIDAKRCWTGSQLVQAEGSVCHGCYALKNFYATWWPAMKARHQRQESIDHPLWPEAMVCQLIHYLRGGGEPYMRWHDSGDLQSVEHLERIAGVARALYEVKFWLPTREYGIVAEWVREGGSVPPNLTIRLSAHWVGAPPRLEAEELLGMPSSTVHRPGEPPVAVSARRADTLACRAASRDNHCGPCRACWSPAVRNVSYPMH